MICIWWRCLLAVFIDDHLLSLHAKSCTLCVPLSSCTTIIINTPPCPIRIDEGYVEPHHSTTVAGVAYLPRLVHRSAAVIWRASYNHGFFVTCSSTPSSHAV